MHEGNHGMFEEGTSFTGRKIVAGVVVLILIGAFVVWKFF
jgi:hypothetical protein